MKILLTGCTAQQASQKNSNKFPTFSSAFQKMLSSEHDVNFCGPGHGLTEEVEDYDAVIVGLSPLTSLSANDIYPAFVLANKARAAGNLLLSIDAPEPYKIQASINSYKSGKVDLLKNFYSKRKNYYHLVNDKKFQKSFFQFVDFLSNEEWPSVIYPAFPWQGSSVISGALSNVDRQNLHGIHIDSCLMSPMEASISSKSADTPYWVCDALNTKWAKTIQKTFSYSALPVKTRSDSSESIEERLSSATAALVSVYRSEDPWWSPLLSQALNASVPVVTEWRYSSVIDRSWSILGSSIESLSQEERILLAEEQKKTYIGSLISKEVTLKKIETIIKEIAK